MWRGPVIERQKQATAKERGKVFTLHAKLIALAAAKWGDPSLNPSLAEAIAKAKKENVPNDNIDRAIKRGSGQEKWALAIEEVFYEGYGAGWVAVVIRALTDNRNRTAPNIRHAFSANGGALGETGSVSNFAFKYRGMIVLDGALSESLEEDIISSGADDYVEEDGKIVIETVWSELAHVSKYLSGKGIIIESSTLEYIPNISVTLSEFDKALKVHTLISDLEEDEDVESVWHNAIIPEEQQRQILEHIEKTRFRT